MKQLTATVISNSEVIPGTHLMWLKTSEPAIKASPGQFFMVSCGLNSEHLLKRPISVHMVSGSRLALLFNEVGKGTQWLAYRQTAQCLELLGPLGNGFFISPDSHNLLLIAGGIGIAPISYLAQKAAKKKYSVKLLMGARTKMQLYSKQMLSGDFEVLTATDDGTSGKKGLVTTLIPDYIGWADQVFVCGPLPMYRNMISSYDDLFVGKPVQVSLEVRMGCGLGYCYACTIKTRAGLKQVCRDGPVFDLNDVIWDELL